MRHGVAAGRRRRVAVLPTTSAGWWAVWLPVLAQALVTAWTFLPLGALAGFVCGLAAGVVAIVRRRERAVTVFAALLPSVFVVVFVVAELVVPHA